MEELLRHHESSNFEEERCRLISEPVELYHLSPESERLTLLSHNNEDEEEFNQYIQE